MTKAGFSYLLILFVLLGCKKEETPPTYLERNGLYEFRIEGVPQENIDTKQNGTIRVQLPADYQGGNRIKVFFRDWEKTLAKPQAIEDGWKGNEIIYEGRQVHLGDRWINLGDQIIEVIPAKPLEILTKGEPYLYTPSGAKNYVTLSVKNWGTIGRATPSDSLPFRLLDKKTGKVVHREEVSLRPPAQDGAPTLVDVELPTFLDAGDYEFVLIRRGEAYVGPDVFRVIYGEPALAINGSALILNGDNRVANFYGQNFLPDHNYQLVLSNDFSPPQKFALIPKNPVTLTASLPVELPKGNYLTEIYIDGKLSNETGIFGIDNLLIVQDAPDLSRLYSLSDSSQSYTVNRLGYLRPTATFKRGQRIIAITLTDNVNSWDYVKLILTEVNTRKEVILDNGGELAGGLLFFRPLFKIPSDIPPGRYEVKYSTKNNEGKIVTSVRYHRAIMIE